jgi:O-antigen/teichoic acid export membrane protein
MRRHDITIVGLLFLLPLVMFWQQTIGGKTLLPTENLYQYEPYATYREVVKAPEIPHNDLLSDLVLQNYQWKSFIRDQFAQGEIPLWNPHTFSGTPFMAAGQQSTLYPLSILYYVMPLTAAYGWFTVVNLWLAGVFMYLLARGLERSRFGATLAAITYQLCGMFIASAVHPMIIGAVVWMPLMLLMAEYIIRQRPLFGAPTSAPWAAIGAVAIACNILSGHPEITIYSLVMLAYYSGLRLLHDLWRTRAFAHVFKRGIWISALVLLGIGLGAVQLIPLYDFVRTNWRAERSSLETVLSYAHPWRDFIQFGIPNFYGSPAHHSYFDVFTGQTVQIGFVNALGQFRTHTDWGMKNYVEGALYVGILPLALAGFAIFNALRKPREKTALYVLIFAALVLISLTFAFGMRTYALIYMLPGINQLNTAFRWIYGVTVGIAVLAAFGADALFQYRLAARRAGIALTGIGVVTLIALLLSRVFYGQIEPLIERILSSMARASEGFNSPEMFYSYQFINVLIFGLMLLGAGIAFLWNRVEGEKITPARLFAVALVAVDLLIASWGFNAASDPALLEFTPPAVQWLQEQPGYFRYMVVNGNGKDILPANMTLRYGLDDVTGYDSIISAQYVDYMQALAPQRILDHNRISPLYVREEYDINELIQSPRFRRLNVRYLITHKTTEFDSQLTTSTDRFPAQVRLAYEDEAVRIWQVDGLPRFYTISSAEPQALDIDQINSAYEVSQVVSDTGREIILNVDVFQETWLVVSQSYAPGWKAFIRPQGGAEAEERALTVERVQENFQGVYLPESGAWTIRLIYSPTSFQVGIFGTVISAAILVLMVGTWVWRLFIAPRSSENSSTASRLARNSIAPIMLNLFNRSIDLVFASVMFRVLGTEWAGYYYLAIAIFGWFDIVSNFGLDVYLMREAGRSRDRAGYFFWNTTALRFSLVLACIPLLLAVLAVRQATGDPLNSDVLLTIAFFYLGLVPGTLSKGLTSLFYAFEQAEYPAAVTTITTICRITFGLMALLLGYGIVGLAAVSIVTNLITLTVLFFASRRMITPQIQDNRLNFSLMRRMTGQSFPLMLNHLLATIFFQIDIVILEWVRDASSVGLYRVAYSWLLAINVIPAFFTQALMPIMSRQWQNDKATLRRTYSLSIKLLTAIAFPMAVMFTFLAEPLTAVLGGSAYLPDGAIALQIMIWSIPIGWMNSLTQYALIAVDLQRRITFAFIVAVAFNIVSNLILIPPFGYQAAALTTIASEAVLFVAFAWLMQSAVGKIHWFGLFWRQAAAGGVMLVTMGILWGVHPVVGLIGGIPVYLTVLAALRPLEPDEAAFLRAALPARVQALVAPLARQGV